MKQYVKKIILSLFIIIFFVFGSILNAKTVDVDASKLLAHVEISLSPRSGSFVEGSTFQVPILLNTKNKNINGIEVRINFDKNKLAIVNSTGGISIIGIWGPAGAGYDNTQGTANYVGVVPGGIITGAGLIGTITFKALSPGNVVVSIDSNSKILLNDGLGTSATVDLGVANYSILAKGPEGVQIFSETHPIQSDWYNNNTPVLSWVKDPGVTGFSFILDNKPNTIPDNVIDTEETAKSLEILTDGLWYFHIKAYKNGVWGVTGQFLMRIDTTPPAEFKPQANFLVAATVLSDRTLVSFFTTDNLSGIDHYEVGVINKMAPPTESPVFMQAESPFQVPINKGDKLEIIVRAIDKAGNVRDESVDVQIPFAITRFFQSYPVYILLVVIFLGLFLFMLHLLIGHHIIRYFRRMIKFVKNEEHNEEHFEHNEENPENRI